MSGDDSESEVDAGCTSCSSSEDVDESAGSDCDCLAPPARKGLKLCLVLPHLLMSLLILTEGKMEPSGTNLYS